ncbi:DUF1254 domain-containing protein [Hansschlegelia quercus]|uniref:DUF1254 domain-containing protein n=1 Tax=Hansschlegelia quercus TaxID=2528245 RepID=A0A4Q9GBV4_9HYPH|nr:DUF1254 domain-containing protein [Hansschlegelia quercus]TBN48640.1 DUF1254 domain-containing protein [Hansschlegelia quercus]
MMQLIYGLALALALGGLTHVSTLLAVPQLAREGAYDRLGSLSADGRFVVLPDEAPDADILPFRDPAFVTAACRYDLSAGAVTIKAALPGTYGALSVHDRYGQPFYALTDKAAASGAVEVTVLSAEDVAAAEVEDAPEGRPALRIVSPTKTGFVLVRLFATAESARPGLREAAATASCARAASRTLSP